MNIILNKQIIGSIKDVKIDMFHIYGCFIENTKFSIIKYKIERFEMLWKKSENNEETKAEPLQLTMLRQEINALNLKAGNDEEGYSNIRDFKIIDGVCEFKFI